MVPLKATEKKDSRSDGGLRLDSADRTGTFENNPPNTLIFLVAVSTTAREKSPRYSIADRNAPLKVADFASLSNRRVLFDRYAQRLCEVLVKKPARYRGGTSKASGERIPKKRVAGRTRIDAWVPG